MIDTDQRTRPRPRPSAQSAHAALLKLQQGIGDAYRYNTWLTEAEIQQQAHKLGLLPLNREDREKATNCDYGLHATAQFSEEYFFHCCFVDITGSNRGERVAVSLTIYINQQARGGWPLNVLTGKPIRPNPFEDDCLHDAQPSLHV